LSDSLLKTLACCAHFLSAPQQTSLVSLDGLRNLRSIGNSLTLEVRGCVHRA
jgi:hypothetical protein